MPGFLGGRTGLVQVIDLSGEGGHRVEVREVQAVDLLLRGGGHRAPTLQHHTHAKVPLLHLPVRNVFFGVQNFCCKKRPTNKEKYFLERNIMIKEMLLTGGSTLGVAVSLQRS